MKFTSTALGDAYLIEPEKIEDARGFFARVFCEDELAAHGLETRFVQMNMSVSHKRGTMRGMHYQIAPAEEAKIFRCIRGALHDVIIDLRPNSPTYRRVLATELTDKNHRMIYIPRGFAHGFMTLSDDVEALYMVSTAYNGTLERGFRYDDPFFNIDWPLPPAVISGKDLAWPPFDPATLA